MLFKRKVPPFGSPRLIHSSRFSAFRIRTPREFRIDATDDVDLGKLIKLKLRILAELLALAPQICLVGIGLRPHLHILAGSHRHRAGDKACDAGNQHVAWCCRRGG